MKGIAEMKTELKSDSFRDEAIAGLGAVIALITRSYVVNYLGKYLGKWGSAVFNLIIGGIALVGSAFTKGMVRAFLVGFSIYYLATGILGFFLNPAGNKTGSKAAL
jgi:hypothetical protein